jgi:hypothetical protein
MKETDFVVADENNFVVVDLVIAKAGAIAGKAPQDILIQFSGEPPEYDDSLGWEELRKQSDTFFQSQAALLGKILIETLPGGTLDRLICYLLRQNASYFRVPYVEPKTQQE